MSDENPHEICTWDDESDCGSCVLNGKLLCKWEAKRLLKFAALAVLFMITTGFGMILTGSLTGNWIPQIVYAILVFLFFTVIETRLLCRHCPYYSRGGWTIRCFANHGLPKVWRFQPEPMNRLEKTSLMVCFTFFGFYPILTEALGAWSLYTDYGSYLSAPLLWLIGITIANVAAAISFFYLLNRLYCPRCVNFSCPFNKVPGDMVKEYLKKNPSMRDGWYKRGSAPL